MDGFFWKNIILVGMPGSGKTTLGRMLAQSLGWTFRDSDLDLLQEFGSEDIPSLFETFGESGFRKAEFFWAQKLSDSSAVISTGGGMVLQKESWDRLKTLGLTIWINSPIEDIVRNLQKDPQQLQARPVLRLSQNINEDSSDGAKNLGMRLQSLYQERKHLYGQAHMSFTPLKTPRESLDFLKKEIFSYGEKRGSM